MPETEMPFSAMQLVIFLSLILLLVGIQLIVSVKTGRRIKRLESLLQTLSERQNSQGSELNQAETSPGGAFEAFLLEDPARQSMVKSEQFTAYRKWRHEKGLNWANS